MTRAPDPLAGSTRTPLKRLGHPLAEAGFILAGGTGLALSLRHRLSEDLDFFGSSYVADEIRALVRKGAKSCEVLQDLEGTFTALVDGTKISVFRHRFPFLEPTKSICGAAVASPIDIASMKLIAVRQRGMKKDFVDLYEIHHSLPMRKVAENLVRRFAAPRIESAPSAPRSAHVPELNPVDFGKALTWFSDADEDPDVVWMPGHNVPWTKIKCHFEKCARQIVLEISAAME